MHRSISNDSVADKNADFIGHASSHSASSSYQNRKAWASNFKYISVILNLYSKGGSYHLSDYRIKPP